MKAAACIGSVGLAGVVLLAVTAGQSLKAEKVLSLRYKPLWCVASSSKPILAIGNEDEVEVYSTHTFRRSDVIKGFDSAICSARFSTDGSFLYFVDHLTGIYRYDLKKRVLKRFAQILSDPDFKSPVALYDGKAAALWVIVDDELAKVDVATGHVQRAKIDASERGGVFWNLVPISANELALVDSATEGRDHSRVLWFNKKLMMTDAIVEIEGEATDLCALTNGKVLVVNDSGTAIVVSRNGDTRVVARKLDLSPDFAHWAVDAKKGRAYIGAFGVSAFDLASGRLLWSTRTSEPYIQPVLNSDGDFLAYGENSRAVVKFPVKARGRE